MRRTALLGTLLAMVGSLLMLPSGNASAGPGTASTVKAGSVAAGKKVSTRFALQALGYGSQIRGGDIPASSGDTAYSVIACTNLAGINRENYEAKATIPGLGAVNGVRTRTWTAKNGRRVSSNASHSIANITLVENALGKLVLDGISSKVSVWHNKTGYHASTSSKLLGLKFTLPDGTNVPLDIPTLGQPIVVPGLLRIEVGESHEVEKANKAFARASALEIELIPTNTRIRVATSRARMAEGVRSGLFQGNSVGLRANVLDPLLKVGATPLLPMACEGTDGKVRTRSIAGVNVPALLSVDALHNRAMGIQRSRKRARGFTEATLANISLADGAIKIEGVKARANVRRVPGRLVANSRGTQVAKITINGEVITLPKDPIEIPGLVKIDPLVVERFKTGISVIALQITLLDGTGATIDIGAAKLRIKRSSR